MSVISKIVSWFQTGTYSKNSPEKEVPRVGQSEKHSESVHTNSMELAYKTHKEKDSIRPSEKVNPFFSEESSKSTDVESKERDARRARHAAPVPEMPDVEESEFSLVDERARKREREAREKLLKKLGNAEKNSEK